MFEILFLLLPIAAAYGWYMGRRSFQQNKKQYTNRLSCDYVTGVNFLLSTQQDRSVDLFMEMLKEDSSSFEAHLTLGNLFRSRGEIEKAVRIHQLLVENTSLSFEQRLLATQELGRDYMAAGVYDRAEKIFQKLTHEIDFKQSALQSLLTIFQLTSEWSKAIETAGKLLKLGHEEIRENIAHFYCELAIKYLSSDDLDEALTLLNNAEQVDKNCARVAIMKGRIFIEQAYYEKAISILKQVYKQDSDLVIETLPLLYDCYQFIGDIDAWEYYLHQCVAANSGAIAELYLADIIVNKQNREAAVRYINVQIQRHPTMRLFYRLMDYYLQEAEEGREKESLILLRKMVGEQIRTKPNYRCYTCGFTSHALYWHCPSCRLWDTIKPIRGLDGQ
ncbi:Lipopolysaccharide assembly protein B [Candidatus Hartigia pinicola]|nr:Lipopolysaccharide assembly protein B [Candidatus Hartigia pinicola]